MPLHLQLLRGEPASASCALGRKMVAEKAGEAPHLPGDATARSLSLPERTSAAPRGHGSGQRLSRESSRPGTPSRWQVASVFETQGNPSSWGRAPGPRRQDHAEPSLQAAKLVGSR